MSPVDRETLELAIGIVLAVLIVAAAILSLTDMV